MKNVNEYNVPCEDCICIALCKSKTYTDLVFNCTLIRRFLYIRERNTRHFLRCKRDFKLRLKVIEKTITPDEWATSGHKTVFPARVFYIKTEKK